MTGWLSGKPFFDHDVRIDDGGFSVALTASALPWLRRARHFKGHRPDTLLLHFHTAPATLKHQVDRQPKLLYIPLTLKPNKWSTLTHPEEWGEDNLEVGNEYLQLKEQVQRKEMPCESRAQSAAGESSNETKRQRVGWLFSHPLGSFPTAQPDAKHSKRAIAGQST